MSLPWNKKKKRKGYNRNNNNNNNSLREWKKKNLFSTIKVELTSMSSLKMRDIMHSPRESSTNTPEIILRDNERRKYKFQNEREWERMSIKYFEKQKNMIKLNLKSHYLLRKCLIKPDFLRFDFTFIWIWLVCIVRRFVVSWLWSDRMWLNTLETEGNSNGCMSKCTDILNAKPHSSHLRSQIWVSQSSVRLQRRTIISTVLTQIASIFFESVCSFARRRCCASVMTACRVHHVDVLFEQRRVWQHFRDKSDTFCCRSRSANSRCSSSNSK